ncbi:MAG: hypothetical protein WCP10_11790 [Desulfuromonadales bacterium]
MRLPAWILAAFLTLAASAPTALYSAETPSAVLEQSMSETLDIWRDGRYENLFERLAHRGKTSREAFVKKMQGARMRPACCWQKMEHFKVLNEKKTEATVYVKLGLDGSLDGTSSSTREFKLTHEGGVWKMQLADIFSLAGLSGKKTRNAKGKKHGAL